MVSILPRNSLRISCSYNVARVASRVSLKPLFFSTDIMIKKTFSTCVRFAFRALPISEGTRYRIRNQVLSSALGSKIFGVPRCKIKIWPVIDKEAVRASAEKSLSNFLDNKVRLTLPWAEKPRVSVLVILFNQAGLSLLCLEALAKITDVEFETIIVDNASSDRVPELLNQVEGAQIIRNEENEGFLLAVNRAAPLAKGEYLLLLNNDALVFHDSLSAAIRRFERNPAAGAVGGQILLWNGQLQEAGSIVWQDGSCLGYGREDDPQNPEYSFVRPVDYCSGAFLMVRRSLFESLNGFDTDYCPAYYEESDFCIRLWKAGYEVIYDPKVRVRHFEFASTGRSNQWALDLQARNRLIFLQKHHDFLQSNYLPDSRNIVFARMRNRRQSMRVLFIDDRIPYPSLGAGFPRAQTFVNAIVQAGHAVTHLPLTFPQPVQGQPEAWPLSDEVEVAWDIGHLRLEAFLRARQGYYQFIVVSRPHNAELLNQLLDKDPALKSGVQIIYDAEALFSLREITQAEVRGKEISPERKTKMMAHELSLARHADHVTTVSTNESRHYIEAGFLSVHVLGHMIHRHASPLPRTHRNGFLFVGAIQSDESPNGDSLIWFLSEVWPLICQKMKAPQLDIIGLCDSETVRFLAKGAVKIYGRVDFVESFYDKNCVFIVPTRFAAGIPHKAHEAAAHGLPMVTTPLIASQLGWSEEVLIGHSVQEFAEHCVTLHENGLLWSDKQAATLQAVHRDCSEGAFFNMVKSLFISQ